ncbi:hypothetical protein F1737_05950 [Methanoplanus sp. FWC-SCC4]|uniref:Biopolymer transporter Tol n=1 Tax=Methanochimaera problematica TaxID=2609417 RepID=A0AA97FCD4_9EURY|nr:hypothetical protein [Methanoplanus sp. FWC-SCC4]WOF16287.1 hypothetical protein F1737_05950 [Methanoplanus sp. FWC-SCC4]
MIKKIAVSLILIISSLIFPCFAQEIPDAELIAMGDVARYNSMAFKDNVVAWIEYGQDENDILISSIHKYNISTGMQETVIADPSGKFSLDFSGDRYVWSDQRGIFFYDESENRLTFLYSKNPQRSPVIDGDIIIWVEDIDDKRSTLKKYDISNGEYGEVAQGGMFDSFDYPAISGDRVVFINEDIYDHTLRLCLYNLNDKNRYTCFADVPDVCQPPAIDGDIIVWTGKYNDFYTTFMYDIQTGKTKPVSPFKSAQLCPDISGSHVVWLDFGPYPSNLPWGGDVYMHNLDSGVTEKISKSHKQDYPKVSGDYVVWLDNWGSGHDIYLYSFLDEGRDFLSDDAGSIYDATPTPLPTPETKVRFYSKIKYGEVEWYSLTTSGNLQLSFELRWSDPDTKLSLSVVSPSGAVWHFTDGSDKDDDNAIRMTISNVNSYFMDNGKWTIAVSGDAVSCESDYDLCWY